MTRAKVPNYWRLIKNKLIQAHYTLVTLYVGLMYASDPLLYLDHINAWWLATLQITIPHYSCVTSSARHFVERRWFKSRWIHGKLFSHVGLQWLLIFINCVSSGHTYPTYITGLITSVTINSRVSVHNPGFLNLEITEQNLGFCDAQKPRVLYPYKTKGLWPPNHTFRQSTVGQTYNATWLFIGLTWGFKINKIIL